MIARMFNIGLRVASLGVKMLLTLYMARYLGLTDLGTFGLVAAFVAIAIPMLGFRLDYVVSREVVDAAPVVRAVKMRDQILFYILTYLGFGLFIASLMQGPLHDLNWQLAAFTFLLCSLESLATITMTNFIWLGRPALANALFFVRAALWAIPVMVLGYFFPEHRTAVVVFKWWLGGVLLSLLLSVYFLRNLPWSIAFRTAVNWVWIRASVKKCLPIWLGAVGLATATNIDRLVVEQYLGREFVGIASFYGSFLAAITALLDSGIFAFTSPKLVALHQRGETTAFRREIIKLSLHTGLFAGILVVAIGLFVPFIGNKFERPEFVDEAPTLWFLLLATWLKSTSTGLYFALYSKHHDRAIWAGNLIMLAVALGSSVVFVPMLGFIGVGYSALTAAVALVIWRTGAVALLKL